MSWAYRSMMSKGLAPVDASPAKDIEAAASQSKPTKATEGAGVTFPEWDNRPLHDSIMESPVSFVPDQPYPKRRGQANGVAVAEGGSEQVPNSMMRKTIARRLKESYLDAPTFFLTSTFDCNALVEFRSSLKNAGVKVSYNDLMVKAVARAH